MRQAMRIVSLLALLLVLAGATACGGSDDGAETEATILGADGEPVEILITVGDDDIDAPQRPTIALGSEVSLVFNSVQDDDAHLHGYDIWSLIGPGQQNRIDFTADEAGIFLVELERDLAYVTELIIE